MVPPGAGERLFRISQCVHDETERNPDAGRVRCPCEGFCYVRRFLGSRIQQRRSRNSLRYVCT